VEGRLITVTNGTTVTVFTYDGDGKRVKQKVGATTTVFIGNYCEIAISGTQRITTTYYYANGQRVAMRTSAGVTYIHSDHLRSTSVTSGAQTGNIKYYPYGATRSGAVSTAYKFTSQRLDDSTGLYYYGARYYDPALGRFVQADTIVPQPGNPQALNRYSYVYNNPLRFIDPTGMFSEEELINWGIYTAEELRWLAENQVNWYNYLMQAAIGDAFWFVNGTDTFGIGQFQLSNGTLTITGGAFSWKDKSRLPVEVGRGSVSQWGATIGQAAIHSWPLEPEKRAAQWLPNPHVQLSDQRTEMNARFVLYWDFEMAVLSSAGWAIVGLDTLLAPPDPVGKGVGYIVSNVGSAAATVTLVDTLLTSGPNSQAMTVNALTYVAGWSSLVWNVPIDLTAAWVQVGYDYYTLHRIQQQNQR